MIVVSWVTRFATHDSLMPLLQLKRFTPPFPEDAPTTLSQPPSSSSSRFVGHSKRTTWPQTANLRHWQSVWAWFEFPEPAPSTALHPNSPTPTCREGTRPLGWLPTQRNGPAAALSGGQSRPFSLAEDQQSLPSSSSAASIFPSPIWVSRIRSVSTTPG